MRQRTLRDVGLHRSLQSPHIHAQDLGDRDIRGGIVFQLADEAARGVESLLVIHQEVVHQRPGALDKGIHLPWIGGKRLGSQNLRDRHPLPTQETQLLCLGSTDRQGHLRHRPIGLEGAEDLRQAVLEPQRHLGHVVVDHFVQILPVDDGQRVVGSAPHHGCEVGVLVRREVAGLATRQRIGLEGLDGP